MEVLISLEIFHSAIPNIDQRIWISNISLLSLWRFPYPIGLAHGVLGRSLQLKNQVSICFSLLTSFALPDSPSSEGPIVAL